MTLLELLEKTTKLNTQILNFLKLSTYDNYDDLSGLDIDYSDSEQLFLLDEFRFAADKLAEAYQTMCYLTLPIKNISTLHLNDTGRYETEDGYVFSSGCLIEALIQDSYHDAPYWVRSSVESDGNRYYILGHKDVDLNGLTVRFRYQPH